MEKEDLKDSWQMIGIYQAATSLIVLVGFYATSIIIGGNDYSFIKYFALAGIIAYFFAGKYYSVFAICFATLPCLIITSIIGEIILGLAFLAYAILLIQLFKAIFVFEENEEGDSRIVLLFCLTEFIVIFLPILGTVNNWW